MNRKQKGYAISSTKEFNMVYPDPEALIELFNRTHWVMKKQADGLSHADSLLQPAHSGNCFNWVLGHIIAGRNSVLIALDEAPIWSEETLAVYKRESEPITSSDQAQPFEDLLADLDETQRRIVTALERIPAEKLEKVAANDPNDRSVGQRVAFLHWHETYHTGQLELLRQLAGKADKII
ncbi:MAG: DinB family protein [Anaerolineae bacterium]|nr:DinB family protein [Anaerolineae bacterium]